MPDAFRRITVRGFQQVVVDNRTSIREIAADIQKGRMSLSGTTQLVLLVGRADVLNGDGMVWVLERLKQATEMVGFLGTLVITGPLPAAHDRPWMCEEISRAWEQCQNFVENFPNCKFCLAGRVFLDQFGVIPALIDESGLTLDGIREFNSALVL